MDAKLSDLSSATAGQLASAIAAGEISSVEAVDAAIGRIERLDGPINAVVVRDFDRARAAAKAADAALARGERRPLLGVPMTVKDSHNVAGLPTTWGLESARDFIADTDAVGVARLKAAGAVIVGKTNIPPNLGDWQSNNPVYGRTRNPLDLERSPGGSSGGGAAALAAGMIPLEYGSDIGGSIRIPAAFCGVFGHKPSFDLIPQRGHTPPGVDGDGVPLAVVGPLARSAEDLDLALGILAGPAGREAAGYSVGLPAARHAKLADYRVLMLTHHPMAPVSREIVAALDVLAGKLDDAGAEVAHESDLLPDLAASHGVYQGILGAVMSRGAPPRPDAISAHDYMNLLDAQESFRRRWDALFERYDAVIAPAFGTVAFPHDDADPATRRLTIDGEQHGYFQQLAWPGIATLGCLPATSAPIATSAETGLPIAAQVMGQYLQDRTTIALAGMLAAL